MIVHLNGQLVPLEQARISPLDRGFILGEGVYEGLRAIAWDRAGPGAARVLGVERHIRRMQQGLESAGIRCDVSNLHQLSRELLAANALRDAFVYWQVSGGTPAPADPPRHRVPPANIRPTLFAYANPVAPLTSLAAPMCKRVITCRDPRWELGWLKSTSLMGNVWVARRAAERGCDEAILIRGGDALGVGGLVSEGLATNIVLVLDAPGGHEIVTPALDSAPMLDGVTRQILLELAPEIRQRPVREHELRSAREVLMVGTTTYVSAITQVDGAPVGDASPGPWARELFDRLMRCYQQGRD